MDEIVREAMNYVNPEKKEEVVDPKAKGKNKNEPSTVDIFAGLDTDSYKEISSEILKQVLVSTGQEKVPGKEVNIISLIKDDALLVNLFIEKLKLTYTQPPPNPEDKD